jgi:hypothetical protein
VQLLPLEEFVFNTEAHPFPLAHSARENELQHLHSQGPVDVQLMRRGGTISPDTLRQAIAHYNLLLPGQVHRVSNSSAVASGS